MKEIFEQIHLERQRQDLKHGGPEHDDTHNASEWQYFRMQREFRNINALMNGDLVLVRKYLIEIAALTVAQIESLDRLTKPTK